jgi:CheY-like chemotaxis protein
VLWNVLRNAVKFTPPGGRIAIESSNAPPGQRVQVRIRDSGIGMKAEDVSRVFEPFVQGDHDFLKGEPAYGGLGVGLAISRTLVERHAGSIRAESPGRGHGTTIVITLPLAETAPASGTPTPPPAKDGAVPAYLPRRVLVVDDHEPTLKTLSAVLQRRGFLVTSASSMQQARQHADGAQFDLLVSDLGLPDGDGCTLMRELRMRQPQLAGIAISGYGMDADLERSTAAGFRDHLTKPINVAALERALASGPSPSAPHHNGSAPTVRPRPRAG